MIYAGINIQLGKPLVDMVRPCLAPPLQQLGAVPVADLLPEPLPVHLAHRQHDMGVGLGHPVLAHVPMRSAERRVGNEGLSTCRYWWSPYHLKKYISTTTFLHIHYSLLH